MTLTVHYLHSQNAIGASSAASRDDFVRPSQRELLCRSVRDALLGTNQGLTRREAEICACIVIGRTVALISQNLKISRHTVATHRKHAYAKLGIRSQSELFALYFDVIGLSILSQDPHSQCV